MLTRNGGLHPIEKGILRHELHAPYALRWNHHFKARYDARYFMTEMAE